MNTSDITKNKKYKMDVTHIVFLSFIILFFAFSLLNTVLSFYGSSFKIDDRILLFIALYAISFSFFTSAYVKKSIQKSMLFILPFLVLALVFVASSLKINLNELNNNLSLIALSISIFLLPFRTFQQKVENEFREENITEISQLKEERENLMNDLQERFEEVKNITELRNNDIRKSMDEKHNLNLEIDKLKRDLEETYNTMNELDRHFNYEKSQIERDYDHRAMEDGMYIAKLEEKIKELEAESELKN
ncbi:hypothetical protein [Exiguobacterium artemiae]|uniref:hypothetical protein n=1 Tax=Exiguobacterium artemiae TaxID=340145 RepID=UPI003D01035B